MSNEELKLYNRAIFLGYFTFFYNIVEGIISVFFGIKDETLTLFGFGIDSFIEAISGVGILQMILRIKKNPETQKTKFEITALKITGICFYLLSIGLGIGIVLNLIYDNKPNSTFIGTIISIISIFIMLWLYFEKKNIGKILNSSPMISDANCTKVCIYMSIVLLISSVIYEITKFQFTDIFGTVGIIYFSIKEGNEAFEKAKGKNNCCC